MLITFLFLLAQVNILQVLGLPHFPDDFAGGELGRVVFGGRTHSDADKDYSLTSGGSLTSVNSHHPNPQSSSFGTHEEAFRINNGPPFTSVSSGDWQNRWNSVDHPFFPDEVADLQRIWFGEPSTATHTSEAEVAFQSPYDHIQIGRSEQPLDFLPPHVSVQPHSTWEPHASPPPERHWPPEGSPRGYGNPSFTFAEDTYPPQMISQAFSSASSTLQPFSAPAFPEESEVELGSGHSPKAQRKPAKKPINRPRLTLNSEEQIMASYHVARGQAGWVPQHLVYDRHWLNRLNERLIQIGDIQRLGPFGLLSGWLQRLLEDSSSRRARLYLPEKAAASFFSKSVCFWSTSVKSNSCMVGECRDGSQGKRNLRIMAALKMPQNIEKFETHLGVDLLMKRLERLSASSGSFLTADQPLSEYQIARILEARRLFLTYACMINTFIVEEREIFQNLIAVRQVVARDFFDSLHSARADREGEEGALVARGTDLKTQKLLHDYRKWIKEIGGNSTTKFSNLWKLLAVWLEVHRPYVWKALDGSEGTFKVFFRYLLYIDLELW